MPPDQLVLVELHDSCGGRIHESEMTLRVAVIDQVLRVIDDVPEPLFACAQRLCKRDVVHGGL